MPYKCLKMRNQGKLINTKWILLYLLQTGLFPTRCELREICKIIQGYANTVNFSNYTYGDRESLEISPN